MAKHNMITTTLAITVADSYTEAPNYPEDLPFYRMDKAIIVAKGMQSGAPTVDLQLVDADGNPALIMVTGAILEMLAAAIKGVSERDDAPGEHHDRTH